MLLNQMKRFLRHLASCVILLFLFGGCSREDSSKTGPYKGIPQAATFARANNCVLLAEAVRREIGTNQPFSIDLQRALTQNKRVGTEAVLNDIVENGEQIESVFEVQQGWEAKCVLRLKCSGHLVSKLRAGGRDRMWLIAFEVENTRPLLRAGADLRAGPDEEDGKNGSVTSGVLAEGKLSTAEKY